MRSISPLSPRADLLAELGIDDNTMVIFTSDNGPYREGGANPDYFDSYGSYRGIKRDLYEGGIRMPMLVRYPRHVKGGTTNDHLVAFWDMMPTFAELTGSELKSETVGLSFLPTLLGRNSQKTHDYLYWVFHEGGGKQALRIGDWKSQFPNDNVNCSRSVLSNKDFSLPLEAFNISDGRSVLYSTILPSGSTSM